MKNIPKSLRIWFIIHFIVDIIFAVPLIFFTENTLIFLGLSISNPAFARLVGAALVAIGASSFFVRNDGVHIYKVLLRLKLLWSFSAVLGLVISIQTEASPMLWLALFIFLGFFCVWFYYWRKI